MSKSANNETMVTWSYSSIKTFQQCPKKYYHLKVAKDVKDVGGEAAIYGQEAHAAAEEYFKNGTPIPKKYSIMEDIVQAMDALEGEKIPEQKLGIRKTADGYEPCGFFDDDVWWRGIADLMILDGKQGYLVDFKTGKSSRYADMKQLDLLAGAAFLHYPELVTLKSALAFVVPEDFLTKKHYAHEVDKYLSVFHQDLSRLAQALDNGVWNPISGPLCGWCPVTSCEHNTKKERIKWQR